MGNQEIKSAMSTIQSLDFSAADLEQYEQKLYTETQFSKISTFKDLLNLEGCDWDTMHIASGALDKNNSGLDSDEKRYEEQALELRQAGYTTREKKLDSLKQGGKFAQMTSTH